jgi:hypothetical protein
VYFAEVRGLLEELNITFFRDEDNIHPSPLAEPYIQPTSLATQGQRIHLHGYGWKQEGSASARNRVTIGYIL